MAEQTKRCTVCGGVKPTTAFSRDVWKRDPDGLRPACRLCVEKSRCVGGEKASAHRLVNTAVRLGEVIRPAHCERCGCATKPEGHHADYTKPLDVEWLCNRCHQRHHAEERRKASVAA